MTESLVDLMQLRTTLSSFLSKAIFLSISSRKFHSTRSYAFSRSNIETIAPFFVFNLFNMCRTSWAMIILSEVYRLGTKLACSSPVKSPISGFNRWAKILVITLIITLIKHMGQN